MERSVPIIVPHDVTKATVSAPDLQRNGPAIQLAADNLRPHDVLGKQTLLVPAQLDGVLGRIFNPWHACFLRLTMFHQVLKNGARSSRHCDLHRNRKCWADEYAERFGEGELLVERAVRVGNVPTSPLVDQRELVLHQLWQVDTIVGIGNASSP
jgi:hypothetical protein